jgi:hypothetical protein
MKDLLFWAVVGPLLACWPMVVGSVLLAVTVGCMAVIVMDAGSRTVIGGAK